MLSGTALANIVVRYGYRPSELALSTVKQTLPRINFRFRVADLRNPCCCQTGG
jgi:hypothetical protein